MNYRAAALTHREMWADTAASHYQDMTLRSLKSTTPNFVTISVPLRSHEDVSTLHDPF